MKSLGLSRSMMRGLLVGGAVCLASFWPVAAQVQTSKTVAHGDPTHEVKVERGEVVYVSGNDVVIKTEDGELRHFNNVPDSVTVLVDGKPLNVHQIKPGMKVEKQTITTTTPKVVTTVETVTGKVWQVSPPNWVILTLENGQNQKFKVPNGQKFTVEGKDTDVFALRKGMVVSAQRVTEVPETVVTQQVKRTGKMPPPPPTPKADVPILIAAAPPAPAPAIAAPAAPAEQAPAKLPKTASQLPLLGFLGTLLCGISLVSMLVRKLA
ncbi:MAG TPA: hypothetical protein VMJ35_02815 [Dongiaceae bacterium]|nr:hypothetical protein [Dongiaceae bacterium]